MSTSERQQGPSGWETVRATSNMYNERSCLVQRLDFEQLIWISSTLIVFFYHSSTHTHTQNHATINVKSSQRTSKKKTTLVRVRFWCTTIRALKQIFMTDWETLQYVHMKVNDDSNCSAPSPSHELFSSSPKHSIIGMRASWIRTNQTAEMQCMNTTLFQR